MGLQGGDDVRAASVWKTLRCADRAQGSARSDATRLSVVDTSLVRIELAETGSVVVLFRVCASLFFFSFFFRIEWVCELLILPCLIKKTIFVLCYFYLLV